MHLEKHACTDKMTISSVAANVASQEFQVSKVESWLDRPQENPIFEKASSKTRNYLFDHL